MDTDALPNLCLNKPKTPTHFQSSSQSTPTSGADLIAVAPIDYRTGYGIDACRKVLGLLRRGYEVFVRPIHFIDQETSQIPCEIHHRIIRSADHGNDWELLISPPGLVCPTQSKKTVLYTTLETDAIPPGFEFIANQCKAIIVPCQWNKESIVASGIRKPIFVCPESVDERFTPMRRSGGNGLFTFGTIAKCYANDGDRKGIDRLIAAFTAAFRENDRVRLKIKIGGRDKVPSYNNSDNRITVIRQDLTLERMVEFMQSLDCYVNSSSGESWCRPLHEAMACGLIVISPMHGGAEEFLEWGTGITVQHEVVQACGGYEFGKWAHVSVNELAAAMRKAESMPFHLSALTRTLAAIQAGKYSMDVESEIFSNILIDVGALKPKSMKAKPGGKTPEDLIRSFYRGSCQVPKPMPPDLSSMNLTNTPAGIGDIMVLTAVAKQWHESGASNRIWHRGQAFRDLKRYLPAASDEMPTNLVSAWDIHRRYHCGNGHFTQRLMRAFGHTPPIQPSPAFLPAVALHKRPDRVIVHLEAGKHSEWQMRVIHSRARQIYDENIQVLEQFIDDHKNYEFVEIGSKQRLRNTIHIGGELGQTVWFMAEASWFIGIMSGPLHIATALGLRCIVIINFPDADKIFLPTLKDIPQVESEWFYPQHVHLHQDGSGPLVPKLSAKALDMAFAGDIYPFWSAKWLNLIEEKI